MATLSLVLDKRRQKKDGTYPLVFQVILKTIPVKISTGISVKEEDFDRKNGFIKSDMSLNRELFRTEENYRQRLEQFNLQYPNSKNANDLKCFLQNKAPNELTITEFWDNTIQELIVMGRLGGANVYKQSKSAVGKYVDLNISFQHFTYRDLLKLEQHMHLAGISVNGMGVYLRTFRAICNKAIKEDVVPYEWYPFRKYRVKKEKTAPRVITKNELSSYFRLILDPSHPSYIYWNIGKLIFMLRGINITDLLQLNKSNIKNKRIIYKRAKTGKIYSIKLTEAIESVFSEFTPNETLLGLVTKEQIESLKRKEHFTQRIKVINKHLGKLGKLLGYDEKLTTYVFRYSYANVSKQLGYSKDLIAEALGHEYGNSVTGIYLEQFDLEVVDSMNDNIIKTVTT